VAQHDWLLWLSTVCLVLAGLGLAWLIDRDEG
jgi:hypothetical protein